MKTESFDSILKNIAPHRDRCTVSNTFVLFAACALAVQTREVEYLEEVKRWTKEELIEFSRALGALVAAMEADPFTDLVGTAYSEIGQSNSTRDRGGEFYTPSPVCRLMARMVAGGHDEDSTDPINVMEPACGSGGMILALAESMTPKARRRLRVTAVDISRTACHMTFINTTLWGIPARIHHGNTLSSEYWAAWSNIHYLVPWLGTILSKDTGSINPLPEQGAPATSAETKSIAVALGQQGFDFGKDGDDDRAA